MHASSPLRKQVTVVEYSIIKLSRIEAENADVMVEEGVAGGGGGGGGVQGVGPTDSFVNED